MMQDAAALLAAAEADAAARRKSWVTLATLRAALAALPDVPAGPAAGDPFDQAYRRYGQWTSYVLQLREQLDRARIALRSAGTPMAREQAQQRIDECLRGLTEMDAQFADPEGPR